MGVCLCIGIRPGEPDMGQGHVTSLGVRRAWRRQGLGLAILHHAFGKFYRRSKARVLPDADVESPTGATRLYEKAGMREGEDRSKQTV